jgi:hypothetical protein
MEAVMMTQSRTTSLKAKRCRDKDIDGGRCQLRDGHEGLHAADGGDAYLTWHDGELHRWRRQPAPHWLLDLSWTPGLQPPFEHLQA